jgi:hypothetical protein
VTNLPASIVCPFRQQQATWTTNIHLTASTVGVVQCTSSTPAVSRPSCSCWWGVDTVAQLSSSHVWDATNTTQSQNVLVFAISRWPLPALVQQPVLVHPTRHVQQVVNMCRTQHPCARTTVVCSDYSHSMYTHTAPFRSKRTTVARKAAAHTHSPHFEDQACPCAIGAFIRHIIWHQKSTASTDRRVHSSQQASTRCFATCQGVPHADSLLSPSLGLPSPLLQPKDWQHKGLAGGGLMRTCSRPPALPCLHCQPVDRQLAPSR